MSKFLKRRQALLDTAILLENREVSSLHETFDDEWEDLGADLILNGEIEDGSFSQISAGLSRFEKSEYLDLGTKLSAILERRATRMRSRDLMEIAEWNRRHPDDPLTDEMIAAVAPDILPAPRPRPA